MRRTARDESRGSSVPVPRSAFRILHAFTMVELVVVVTILLILIGLVVSVSSRAIDSSKQRQAKAVLDILDTAIEQFASPDADPLRSWRTRSGPYGPAGPYGLDLDPIYKRGFGAFPPHYDWYADGQGQGDGVREWTLAERPTSPQPPVNNSRAALLYPGLAFFDKSGPQPVQQLRRHVDEYNDLDAMNPRRFDLENSENLYFFLTQLSPEAKVILDRLPPGTLTNTDIYARKSGSPPVTRWEDGVDLPPLEQPPKPDQDLMEFRDPWGNVISYWVYYFKEEESFVNGIYEGPPPPMGTGRNEPLISPVPVLESAGPDGKFGHRPGIGHNHNNPHPLDDDKALPDNLFSRPPPWQE